MPRAAAVVREVEPRAPREDMVRVAAVRVAAARVAAARARADEEVDAEGTPKLNTGQLLRILLRSTAFRKKCPN